MRNAIPLCVFPRGRPPQQCFGATIRSSFALGWRRGMIESMEDATLLDLFASLSREISGVKEELSGEIGSVRQELRDGFERVEARLKLHGGLLNGGARQVTRLIEWSEKVNEILAERDARIAELTRRVDKLEGKD